MTDHGQTLLDGDNVAAFSPVPSDARRRGSVLILVMTLLGVMFVMGIAFLATMNFEAGQVSSDRQRGRSEAGVDAVADDFSSVLRDGLLSAPGTPFGASLLGTSSVSFAELPGVQNTFAPIEPTRVVDPNNPGLFRYVYPWITDVYSLKNKDGQSGGTAFRQLEAFAPYGIWFDGIDTSWPSGVPIFLSPDVNPDVIIYPVANGDLFIYPVDADGDGITDTLQFPAEKLGFSKPQTMALSHELNTATNPTGQVYVGLRIVAHGGLVNINESHPALIRNVFDLQGFDLTDPPDPEYNYFLHRPSQNLTPYSPLAEESMLRRRSLLPPREMPPSLLQGNPSDRSTAGRADIAKLIPPSNDGIFGSTISGKHRYTPFSPYQRWNQNDADSDPLWAVRMEPFASYTADNSFDAYDRRHLVTTISHDDLLSRGGTIKRFEPAAEPPIDGELLELLEEFDLRDRMMEINRAAWDPDECPLLPFEYANYPITLPNGGNCGCATESNCEFNVRKGRLQLSLAWLDDNLACESQLNANDREECSRIRRRLIHDVFMMLVRNARGPYWDDDMDCRGNDVCESVGEYECDQGDGLCRDSVTDQTRRLSRISRTAASLTANMIDYMDFDDANNDGVDDNMPTRVPLRSFDFADTTCDDESNNRGAPCAVDANCNGGKCVATTAGWEFGSTKMRNIARQYVYGLERQPYITEVASNIPADGALMPDAWAVELYNPYNVDLVEDSDGDGTPDWWLIVRNAAEVLQPAIPLPLTPTVTLRAGEFTAFKTSAGAFVPINAANGVVHDLPGNTPLNFDSGSTIYLVRRTVYPDDDNFGAPLLTDIVVDQFLVDPDEPNIGGGTFATAGVYSMERVVQLGAPWTATVPNAAETAGHTLGTWNDRIDPKIRPVEVNFANTGSFTRPDPHEIDPFAPVLGVAFPTTGSLLLLMRHANRALADYTLLGPGLAPVNSEDLSFTSWLIDEPKWFRPDPNGILGAAPVTVEESEQVDNGRMPIYDLPLRTCGGAPIAAECVDDLACVGLGLQCLDVGAAHHVLPGIGACCLPQGTCFDMLQDQCFATNANAIFVLGAECSLEACQTEQAAPGGLRNLPWGQLVFDYFTVLPLESDGPYTDPTNDPDFEAGKPDSIPRVDLDGLRVHGRININAAPWKVLAGLPMVPMRKIPESFRAKVRWGAGLVNPNINNVLNPDLDPQNEQIYIGEDDALPIGDSLAQSIVAYRGLSSINDTDAIGNPVTTGDFGNNAYGRGWNLAAPASRRGSGFLSIGELAQVRHPEATTQFTPAPNNVPYSYHRFDFGQATKPGADYVEAVAQLVALGDWVTVRSHVFTLYGTLRGELDPDLLAVDPLQAAADVDTRALRFQETVDRLPTFLGEPSPVRIGERVLQKYRDVRND